VTLGTISVTSDAVDTSTAAVSTSGLTKIFGQQTAVDHIDLVVPSGAVYGFLGPNGSGKTTTIRMLLGLIRPSSGSCSVLGHPMPDELTRALPRVGALAEGPAFHPYLSGRANLHRLDSGDRFAVRSTARKRIDEALERVGLLPAATKRYRAYSLGMRQRLALAAALLQPRELLILDEPTNGLDPQGTREVRNLIGELAAAGSSVMVSSHLLSEVQQVCTHLGIMRTGELVAQGPVAELRAATQRTARITTPDTAQAVATLRQFGIDDTTTAGDEVAATVTNQPEEELVSALVKADVRIRGFSVQSPSLEDLFIRLTGEGFDVSG